MLKDRIKKCEDETEKMVYEKVEVQQKILDEEQKKEHLEKMLEQTSADFHLVKVDYDMAKLKFDDLAAKVLMQNELSLKLSRVLSSSFCPGVSKRLPSSRHTR